MSQEVVGEVTIRSSNPDPPVVASSFAAAPASAANLADFLPPNSLIGPVTIRMSGDGREMMIGGVATAAAARIHLDGADGDITVRDFNGMPVLRFDSRFAVLDIGGTGNEGDIRVRNNNDAVTIHLDGNRGDIRLTNADAAEEFDVADPAEPGTVMVMEDDGLLHPSRARGDRRVIGVVAGKGDFRPGVVFDRRETSDIPRAPISIMGKVMVNAVCEDRPIWVGDLLTTSSSPGHAMAADTEAIPRGAIIGKALESMSEATGTIGMLVNLQ